MYVWKRKQTKIRVCNYNRIQRFVIYEIHSKKRDLRLMKNHTSHTQVYMGQKRISGVIFNRNSRNKN